MKNQEQFKCSVEAGTFRWFENTAFNYGYRFAKSDRGKVNKLLEAIANGDYELEKLGETTFSLHTPRENFICLTQEGTLAFFKEAALNLGYTYADKGSVGKLLYSIRCGDVIMKKARLSVSGK